MGNARLNAPVEWAGIAIRLTDGTISAFELERQPGSDVYAQIDVEALMEDRTHATDTFRRMEPTGETVVDIRLHGRGRRSARFQQAADEHRPRTAIDPARPELEP